jgi:hypothetical protein
MGWCRNEKQFAKVEEVEITYYMKKVWDEWENGEQQGRKIKIFNQCFS